ncbi:ABC transporter ATP-binding protein/permease [Acinetobacter sp. HY1485]|uniref:ABC transporter ATP-binding protein/permease n=1 Tax=Acinetobacter sp. HY1485 TaxID=2970918 RepID=UPI0022B94193|nr:ABC transporter ATP-binding protein/permease [Acinetobacter sp. HY1485]
MMKKNISAWQVLKPYWVSDEKWFAFGLLALVITLDMSNIYVILQITHWQKDFYDALTDYKVDLIKPLLITLLGLVTANITARTFSTYFEQMLEIRWRTWLTHHYISDWLKGDKFYHIEKEKRADNPDQRIAEDLGDMAKKSLSLSTGLLKNCVNLVSYGALIWSVSNTWVFNIQGADYIIPGAMLWVAIIYAFLGSYIMEKIGRPMVSLNYKQQQYEADFRALLINIRSNAEQIALYKGQEAEKNRLVNSFVAIRQNWRGIMTYTKRIAVTESVYIEAGAYIPYLLVVPQYLAKKVTLGGMMQLTSSFMRVRASLSWFIFNYQELSALRAALKRLTEFQSALYDDDLSTIECKKSEVIATHNLRLNRPNGNILVDVPNLQITSGNRVLIQGESGVGKSTLLRALAGLWKHGVGTVERPIPEDILFLPQKSYLPYGTIKEILCYPKHAQDFSDEACNAALTQVNLALDLHDADDWENILSLGEQQRLAFAKIVLQQPKYVFLDEATSALDTKNETRLYTLLDDLPQLTVISVAHRDNVQQFHHETVVLRVSTK